MSEKNSKKGKSRDDRDRLTFDVGGLRDRLRTQERYPGEPLASIIRTALVEWLSQKESQEKYTKSDKNDISTNDNN
ncbi:MAG: hypothetical protein QQW96_03675 [Tychonema bourrellyi B0820]|nr:hypothetical protein [Tychonema bourrellyi B0820]PJE45258.1 MAG: hypothetical protein CUR32_01260 [Flavobacterium sp.] [Flavobacterium sp. FEMGT703F]